MEPTNDLLAPETLGPPAELPRLHNWTVVPAMARVGRPGPRPAPARGWVGLLVAVVATFA